jgi:phosphatidylglycerol:prolipoprotein diacylglycerol transferase
MHPILFHLGSKAIYSHGVFVTLGFVISFFVILYLSKRQGLPVAEVAAYLFFGVIVTTLGSKLFILLPEIAKNFPSYLDNPREALRLPRGGSFYGGVILGIFFSLWYLKKFRLPFWKVADIAAVGAALGFSIVRIGCFLAGCCYGRPTSLPWGIHFPSLPGPVHPTQLYESGLNFLNFAVLLAALKRKKFDGQVLCIAIWINSSIRLFIEFFRDDSLRDYVFKSASPFLSLSVAQLISLTGLLTGTTLYFILKKGQTSH